MSRLPFFRTTLLFFAAALSAFAADPWIGVWQLNRFTSTVSRPQDLPLNETLVFQSQPGQQVQLIDMSRDNIGKATSTDCTFRFDGHQAHVRGAIVPPSHKPANAGPPNQLPPQANGKAAAAPPRNGSIAYDAAAFVKTGASAFQATTLGNGRVVGIHRYEVSQDGKTLTVTADDVSDQGEALHNVFVYQH